MISLLKPKSFSFVSTFQTLAVSYPEPKLVFVSLNEDRIQL